MPKSQAKKAVANTSVAAKAVKGATKTKAPKGKALTPKVPKKPGGKKPTKPVEAKAITTPATEPTPAVVVETPKSVHADEPQREVRWSERRVAVVKAMRQLGAESAETARTAGEVAVAAGIPETEAFRVKVALDVYRTGELLHNGYAKSVRWQGERELRYYLTEKGLTTEFSAKE